MRWKPEQDAVIIEGIAEKWSASVIAEKLGIDRKRRSCVTARASRLGLHLTGGHAGRPPRQGPQQPRARPRRRHNVAQGPQATPPELPAPIVTPDQSHAVNIFALERGMCRWPLWSHKGRTDPATSLYCGAASADERYCAYHRHPPPPPV